MKYEQLTLLIEKNIYYKPPKDKEQLLYDFYMLTLLNSLPYSPDVPKNKRFSKNDIGIETSIKEAVETIVDQLKPEMMDAIEYVVAAEFRHIYDTNTKGAIHKLFANHGEQDGGFEYTAMLQTTADPRTDLDKDERDQLLGSFYNDITKDYQDSYIAMKKSGIPTPKFMKIAIDGFSNMKWDIGYGGDGWSEIAKSWFLLDKAKSTNDKIIAIDHAYDLQHNTDTIFNKIDAYYKDGPSMGYKWIKHALDFKKNIKNIWELYPKVSSDVKSLTGYIAKDKGYGTLEDFLKKSKKIKIPKPLKPYKG